MPVSQISPSLALASTLRATLTVIASALWASVTAMRDASTSGSKSSSFWTASRISLVARTAHGLSVPASVGPWDGAARATLTPGVVAGGCIAVLPPLRPVLPGRRSRGCSIIGQSGRVVSAKVADSVAFIELATGWNPEPGRFQMFAVDVANVCFISYDFATRDQHVAMWPPGREFIRHATCPTSLGEAEPAREMIIAS